MKADMIKKWRGNESVRMGIIRTWRVEEKSRRSVRTMKRVNNDSLERHSYRAGAGCCQPVESKGKPSTSSRCSYRSLPVPEALTENPS